MMKSHVFTSFFRLPLLLLLLPFLSSLTCAYSCYSHGVSSPRHVGRIPRLEGTSALTVRPSTCLHHQHNHHHEQLPLSRRTLLQSATFLAFLPLSPARADDTIPPPITRTRDAQITDRIVLQIKGIIPSDSATENAATTTNEPRTIVIGLFGNDAPEAVAMLKQLVSPTGLPAPCKPLTQRTLQREQLEANKVYNACVENQSKGVTYDLGTIWRVVQDERIDVGAVQGKFISREFPNWQGSNTLQHDAFGVVSVYKGNESGFGFTIYPGTLGQSSSLDDTHLVVGRVLDDSLHVVRELNQVPVVTSAAAKVTMKELSPAPSRACRYGGSNLFCNEYKPLQKLSITQTKLL